MITAVNDIAVEWYVDPKRRSEFVRIVGRDGIVRTRDASQRQLEQTLRLQTVLARLAGAG